jgi:hypothetical protein
MSAAVAMSIALSAFAIGAVSCRNLYQVIATMVGSFYL